MSAATLMVAGPTASSSRLLADVSEPPGYGGDDHGRPLDRLAAALSRDFADRVAEVAKERGELS